jgi:hypothetical protein
VVTQKQTVRVLPRTRNGTTTDKRFQCEICLVATDKQPVTNVTNMAGIIKRIILLVLSHHCYDEFFINFNFFDGGSIYMFTCIPVFKTIVLVVQSCLFIRVQYEF